MTAEDWEFQTIHQFLPKALISLCFIYHCVQSSVTITFVSYFKWFLRSSQEGLLIKIPLEMVLLSVNTKKMKTLGVQDEMYLIYLA